jgi:hypothetical protein
MKNSTVRAGPKSNRKIVDKDEIDTPDDSSVHMHNISNKFKRLVLFVYC